MDITKLLLIPERPIVRNDRVSEIDLVVEVSTHLSEKEVRSAEAVNLCLVIDRSGSMRGEKLETAKRSSIEIFRRLTPGDLLTVVAFDDDVSVIVNAQTPSDLVEAKISSVAVGGMTNLSLGWYQGLLELQTHMQESHYNRLFLLSDGQANRGETKRAVFAETATQARDVGISASTIGIGSDYQEDLLEAVASSSGGRFWNISDSDIEDIIEEEFRGALTVLYDRPRVALTLPSGVRVTKELNDLRKVGSRYRMRPIQGEDTFNFAVRVEIDPEKVDGTKIAIGCALFDGDRAIVSTEQELTLGSAAELADSPSHPLVRSVVEQFTTIASEERLLEELDSGNLVAMQEMLTAEIARLREAERNLGNMSDLSRGHLEFGHVHQALGNKIVSSSIMYLIRDLIRDYENEPAVLQLIGILRKDIRREGQRIKMRRHSPTPWDDEAPMIMEALSVVDQLITAHPEDSQKLNTLRERLREHLANS